MQPRPLRYLLVADGSSDACLKYPIEWLLRAHGWEHSEGEWADLRSLPESGSTLADRLRMALGHYSGEILFIHRDAEAQPSAVRFEEIEQAIASVGCPWPYVCVVPVRMTEAWLLHNEVAIRRAAGKPSGKCNLALPSIRRIEGLSDPKSVLRSALLTASEATGRQHKRKIRDFGSMRYRVAELIDDYGPLRELEAFGLFEQNLLHVLKSLGGPDEA